VTERSEGTIRLDDGRTSRSDVRPVIGNSLPQPARVIAVAASAAVDAATRRDAEALDAAAHALAAADGSGLVLGMVVRLRLEELHPDGIAGDDARAVLEGCVRSAAEWLPWVDPHVVLVLLASAWGVHDPADGTERRPSDPGVKELARHGPLLVAHVMAGAPRPLGDYVTGAFAEIRRGELND
jgi:hypothetical protein